MRHQTLVLGFLALILIGAIITAGCAKERKETGANPAPPAIRTPTPPARPTTTPALPVAGTCTAKSRSVCNSDTDCPGRWLDATDTFSGSPQPCTSAGGNAIVTIDPYGTEVTNSDIGDIL
jgi:hypothetical protein